MQVILEELSAMKQQLLVPASSQPGLRTIDQATVWHRDTVQLQYITPTPGPRGEEEAIIIIQEIYLFECKHHTRLNLDKPHQTS